jgi:hypothetical protein
VSIKALLKQRQTKFMSNLIDRLIQLTDLNIVNQEFLVVYVQFLLLVFQLISCVD